MVWSALVTAVILLLSARTHAGTTAPDEEIQICDIDADYSLGVEDYAAAVRLHREVVRKHPQNALAHYHLGFAEGMLGHRAAEIAEYQRAEALGIRNWDLFLNCGLAQFEVGNLTAATNSLRLAVLLGGDHAESHFNLALVEERRGMLSEAENQTLIALRLSPGQPDERNLLGVIYAEEGKAANAADVWHRLAQDDPGYQPAAQNLQVLDSADEVEGTGAAQIALTSRGKDGALAGRDSRINKHH